MEYMGHVNRAVVLSRAKTDVSRGGGVGLNDNLGKNMADRYILKNDLESWSRLDSREVRSAGHTASKRLNNMNENEQLKIWAIKCIT